MVRTKDNDKKLRTKSRKEKKKKGLKTRDLNFIETKNLN